MSRGRRDRRAARHAAIAFLASAGAVALAIWPLSNWLAGFAIYPPIPEMVVTHDYSVIDQIEDAERDYRWMLNQDASFLVTLAAFYWSLAYLLGAALYEKPASTKLDWPAVGLALALVSGIVFAFLRAAPRFVVAPVVDACTARHHAAYPNDPCEDCGIHRCEEIYALVSGLAFLLVVGGLLAWSLRLRYRWRRPAPA